MVLIGRSACPVCYMRTWSLPAEQACSCISSLAAALGNYRQTTGVESAAAVSNSSSATWGTMSSRVWHFGIPNKVRKKRLGVLLSHHRTSHILRMDFSETWQRSCFLDLTASYDTVWHGGLLVKLSKSLPYRFTKLMEVLLPGRRFGVHRGDDTSAWRTRCNSILWGSVLAPILFNL